MLAGAYEFAQRVLGLLRRATLKGRMIFNGSRRFGCWLKGVEGVQRA